MPPRRRSRARWSRARLAACVSVGAPVDSLYHWRGQIETAQEVPVTIKTRAERYAAVEAAILARPPLRTSGDPRCPHRPWPRTLPRLDRAPKPRRLSGCAGASCARRRWPLGSRSAHGAAAAAEPKLLPNERAFAFSARGVDERTVEARFVIADGYYLYRDKHQVHRRAGSARRRPRCRRARSRKTSSSARSKPTGIRSSSSLPLEAAAPGSRGHGERRFAGLRGPRRLLPAADPEGHPDAAAAGGRPGMPVEAAPRQEVAGFN